jgi:predicted metal-dependent phosphotriesterase family hydrolase
MARCHELLRGAIDLHTHSSPSFFDRLLEPGVSEAEIRTMVAGSPARLLGLD